MNTWKPIASVALAFALLHLSAAAQPPSASPRLNILLITADDLNCDSVGAFGSKAPGITPNIDRLAQTGMRFTRAHVTVAVCQPSRECLLTGRYPHRNGATGFYPVRADVPTLAEQLKAAGYRLGILGKTSHVQPRAKFPWDYAFDGPAIGQGRDPARYRALAAEFFAQARESGKPFFLMANSHDPHRPWPGSEHEKNRPPNHAHADGTKEQPDKARRNYPEPGRTYRPDEIVVPGFLPDLPDIRTELAQYYSAVHRCDETVGAVLRALAESGLEDSTLVVFLSDNGISMPFAKSNCYLASTRTPWIVRWPGRTRAGAIDDRHFISGIDYMPTMLEAAGLPPPAGMDGRSFLPILDGRGTDERDRVFTCYNETSARSRYTMRCVQTVRFGYIFNDWADGKTAYKVEAMSGLTFKAMEAAAGDQPAVAARVEFLLHRAPEEFYDFEADPDALHNLIADPKSQPMIERMRAEMLAWMEETHDPVLARFRAKVRGTR